MVNFDGALKDVLQHDRPTLLQQLTGGVPVREFLNVELPKVQDRRVDLLLLLADSTLLHIEVQSSNDTRMPYRMIEYWSLIKRRFPHPLRQVVLFVGRQAPKMAAELEEDGLRFSYRLTDIRGIKAETLLRTGNPGDLALSVLASESDLHLHEILSRAAGFRGSARQLLLSKILVLAGLRGMTTRVQWELKNMGDVIDWRENPVLVRFHRNSQASAAASVLREMLKAKFGPLPKWADDRLADCTFAQCERWVKSAVTARTVDAALGRNTKYSRRQPLGILREP